jgi:uncharacterized alpha-E superfamily protein
MLSRIAESLYWMSRYLERVDDTARIIDINRLHMVEAEDALPEVHQWAPLLRIVRSEELFAEVHDQAPVTSARAIHFMVQERANPGSLYSSLRVARENARVVRDRISRPMWETINELWLFVERQLQQQRLLPERAPNFLAAVRKEVARINGLAVGSMMRGEAFGLYLLGTCLERADMTARILDVKYHLLLPDGATVGSALDYYQWAALLKSLSGFEAYRRKYHSAVQPIDVAEFLVLDGEFPRSLRFCVERIVQAVGQLGPSSADAPSVRTTQALLALLAERDAPAIFEHGLHEFLIDFLDGIATVDAALRRDYFESHLATSPCAT